MKVQWSSDAWDDYVSWQEQDRSLTAKINGLIKEARRDPFRGLGKPESLRGDSSGWWSRRITSEHRLIYRVSGRGEAQTLEIAQCRYHYDS